MEVISGNVAITPNHIRQLMRGQYQESVRKHGLTATKTG
jgi:hypothetical protein